ncbi:carboxypeptidase regulatory-like domain-containing protein, partial [Actinoplanes sp. RD1]|uniref:carboxypeptidase regulatory-like domain-containing protein n=1 Tax=Actinoplanes sp. RD1 TaxID=3064538 RepID=UPI002741A4ED
YAVGAVDSTGAAAYFSSRGAAADGSTRPDIAAPGVNTLSSVPGGGYELNSGTSMAAPHVSGAVALLWSAQPNLRRDVEATRALLDSTAHDADDTSCGGTAADNNVYGEGRLDAYALVEAATGGQHGGVTVDVTGAGSPMPDAVVKLTSDVVTRTARTGADGRAELGRVPAGTYTLAVSRFAQLTQRRTLTLAAGDAPQLTVDLTAPAPWHQVHGTITGPGGKPLAGVTVKLADETFPGFTTKADGTFSGPLPEGDYDVIIDYGRWLAPKTVPLTVDGDETLDVTLEAKADRYGYTVAETTAKFTTGGNVFKLTGDDAAADASLPFPVTIYGRTYRKVTVHTDGYLSFAGEATINGFRDDLVLDKKSQVHTRTTGSGTTRTFGVTWQGALIKGTSTRIDVQILLGEGGALTVVWHNVGTGTAATVGIVDDKGGDSLTYGTVPGDKVAVTFAVPGAGLVRGTVTDANDGKPVASASVTAGPVTTVTDADGVWQVQVPAGDAVVAATKASYESGSATVAVRAGAVTVVRTSLRTSLLTAPAKVSATVKAGGTATIQVPLRNKGTVAATYDAREVNSAQKPAGVPGKVLGSFGVGDFYNAYGVDWHDGKLLVTDTYFWGQVERFDESGKVLTKGVVGMNGWASDFTPIGDDLTCAPSMSIVGDLPIVCINRDTLTVEQEIPTPKPGTLYYGLAYRAADDTFYLAGDGGIRHIAGPRHPQPGAVLGMCVPARPWTTGLELNEKANVLWSINQDNAGEALRALDPDTCAELSWVPDPDTDPLSGAGITLDDSGDLWTVGQAIGQPGGARVHHVAGDLPAYSEIPWLTVAAPAGSVPVGGAASLPVTLDTSGLARGTYTAHVLLVSNGATTPSVPVAVTVTVS